MIATRKERREAEGKDFKPMYNPDAPAPRYVKPASIVKYEARQAKRAARKKKNK